MTGDAVAVAGLEGIDDAGGLGAGGAFDADATGADAPDGGAVLIDDDLAGDGHDGGAGAAGCRSAAGNDAFNQALR